MYFVQKVYILTKYDLFYYNLPNITQDIRQNAKIAFNFLLDFSVASSFHHHFNIPYSSVKRRGVYLILGLLGAAFIGGRRLFLKIKIEVNEIMC